jgi:hypothetical protein
MYLANDDFETALDVASNYIKSFTKKQIKLLVPDLLNQKARALMGLGRNEDAYPILLSARSLATEQNSRRILWAILLDLAELEEDKLTAENYRQEARQIIEYISEHISDSGLRQSFQSLPRVRKVILVNRTQDSHL